MTKHLQTMLYLFPLFLVGIFFIVIDVLAQQSTVSAIVKISVCGNNIYEAGESCDNTDFGGRSCSNYGFNSGSLACNPDCTVNTASCSNATVNPPGGGGSGGGGGVVVKPTQASVIFSGRAYPLSAVSILRDGQLAVTTIAGPNAEFKVTLAGLSTGNYNFSVYSEDKYDNRSTLFSFPVYVSAGSSTDISGIFLAPTIDVDKTSVKYGEDIAIFGQTVPEGTVTISVNSPQEHFKNVRSGADGAYLYYFDTAVLELGEHHTKAKAKLKNEVSSFGYVVNFVVIDTNSPDSGGIVGNKPDNKKEEKVYKGDSNKDSRVNLVDFSIVAYWYNRSNPPAGADLNNDGQVNLVDLSIMAYYWTG